MFAPPRPTKQQTRLFPPRKKEGRKKRKGYLDWMFGEEREYPVKSPFELMGLKKKK